MRSPALVALVALAAWLLSGCGVAVTAEVTVAAGGGGDVAVRIVLDEAAVSALDELDVDPTAEAEGAAAADPAWEVARAVPDGGGLEVLLSRSLDDARDAPAVLDDLVAGLTDADPALLVDLDLDVDPDGAVVADGEAGLRGPGRPVATRDDEPVGPDPDELTAALADVVDAGLVLRVPGPVRTSDAEVVDTSPGAGSTVRWELPVGEVRQVQLVADAPRWTDRPEVRVVAVAAAALLVVLLLVWLWRRRRRRRRVFS
jgi:hypothetical protein